MGAVEKSPQVQPQPQEAGTESLRQPQKAGPAETEPERGARDGRRPAASRRAEQSRTDRPRPNRDIEDVRDAPRPGLERTAEEAVGRNRVSETASETKNVMEGSAGI